MTVRQRARRWLYANTSEPYPTNYGCNERGKHIDFRAASICEKKLARLLLAVARTERVRLLNVIHQAERGREKERKG